MRKWNDFIAASKTHEILKFHFIKCQDRKNNKKWTLSFLELYLHLVDFLFIRKITGMVSKDFNQLGCT